MDRYIHKSVIAKDTLDYDFFILYFREVKFGGAFFQKVKTPYIHAS